MRFGVWVVLIVVYGVVWINVGVIIVNLRVYGVYLVISSMVRVENFFMVKVVVD